MATSSSSTCAASDATRLRAYSPDLCARVTPALALLDLPDGGALLCQDLRKEIVLTTRGLHEPGALAARLAPAVAAAEAGLGVVLALDYELGQALEPAAGAVDSPVAGLPSEGGRIAVFERCTRLSRDELARWLSASAGEPPEPAVVADFAPRWDAARYVAEVERIRTWIAAGDCYQVNLTFPFAGRCLGDPLALYARLRRAQPVAHGGFLRLPGRTILSLSPELFVSRTGGRLLARPMKGTAPRGPDPQTDAEYRAALAASEKDRAENVMIVDLIRNDLGRVARPGTVAVDALCAIEAYPSVFQMTSTVRAESDAAFAEVLRALFPCGSITGAPKIRAMQIIRALEQRDRGIYTGALGWLGRGGDFSLNVAIRTLQIDGCGQVSYSVGSGIVWDSEPGAEYRECLLKARFVQDAEPGFRLIETVRLDNGQIPLRAWHHARLEAALAALGFAPDGACAAARTLDTVAARHPTGVWRVRLTVGRQGDVAVDVGPLAPLASPPGGWRASFAEERLASGDPWLRFKTTVRARYDAALAALADTPAVFDRIFLNERDEVCEGARSNVFIPSAQDPDVLETPPLACGVLPGVLRQSLLAAGRARERVLTRADLESAPSVFLGNALRGLVAVCL